MSVFSFDLTNSNRLGLDPILRNIVEAEARDITRAWRICDDESWYKIERKYNLTRKVHELIAKSKLFGGAWFLPIYSSDVDLKTPLSPRDRATGFRIISAEHVKYSNVDGLYQVSTIANTLIHHSRLVLAPHNELYLELDYKTGAVFSGQGDAETLYSEICRMNDADAELLLLMRKAIIDVRSQAGLLDEAERASRNPSLARQFESVMQYLKDAATKAGNSVGIVADLNAEKVERLSVAGGISSLVAIPQRFADRLVAASGLPKTKVFGDQQAGLQNNGGADLRKYYDACDVLRTSYIFDAITIADMVMAATEGRDAPAWTFGSFWQETEAEQAATSKLQAEVDKIYFDIVGDAVYEPILDSARFKARFGDADAES